MITRSIAATCALLAATLPAKAEPTSDTRWSGFYTGVTLSYGEGNSRTLGNRFTFNQNQALNRVDHAYDGFGFGGFLGWNKRVGSAVYGAEFSISTENLGSRLRFNADNDLDEVEIQWSGALTGRYGRIVGDTLLYGRGGVAIARIRNLGGDVNGGALTLSDAYLRNSIDIGPIVAVGAERFVNDDWLLRIEYSVADYGNFSRFNQDGAPNSQLYQISNGPVQRLSLGIAFQF